MQNASLALLSDVNANKNIKPYGKLLQIAYALMSLMLPIDIVSLLLVLSCTNVSFIMCTLSMSYKKWWCKRNNFESTTYFEIVNTIWYDLYELTFVSSL